MLINLFRHKQGLQKNVVIIPSLDKMDHRSDLYYMHATYLPDISSANFLTANSFKWNKKASLPYQ